MIVLNVGHGMRWTRRRWRAFGADERRQCGRRSRVVLTPRCWRQARDDASHHVGDGGKKADRRGEHGISRKTIAQGRPDCFR
jgi:hypothetical protein